MQWFRWYHGTTSDPKIAIIAKRAGVHIAFAGWTWAALLESASDNTRERGTFTISDDELAVTTQMDLAEVRKLLKEFRTKGMIKGKKIMAFELRNPQRDSSVERVRNYRERIKSNGGTTAGYRKHFAALMKRDGGRCVYCGTNEKLCIDHMVPVQLGGSEEEDNLAIACKPCNSGKAGRTPEQAGYDFRKDAGPARSAYLRTLQRISSPDDEESVTPSHGDSNSPVTRQNRVDEMRVDESREEDASNELRTSARDPNAIPVDEVDRAIQAANDGLRTVLSDRFNPIPLSHGSRQDVIEWLAEGIPIDVVETAVRVAAARYKPNGRHRQINTMKYFNDAVHEEHDRVNASNGGNGSAGTGDREPATREVAGKTRNGKSKFAHLVDKPD